MRWLCVLLAVSVCVSAPWMTTGVAHAQSKQPVDAFTGINSPSQSSVVQVGMTEVRQIEIEGAHAGQIPEPSVAAALGLVGTAFLIRRRRPRID